MVSPNNSHLQGLGGWLVLVGIILVAGLLAQTYLVIVTARLLMNGTVKNLSNSQSAGYIPEYTGLSEFAVVAHAAFIVAFVWLLLLYFREERRFPRHFVIFLAVLTTYTVVHHALFAHVVGRSSQLVQQNMSDALSRGDADVVRVVLGFFLWGSYMVVSKRVKATFVN